MTRHLRGKHGVGKGWPCEYCGRVYYWRTSYTQHMQGKCPVMKQLMATTAAAFMGSKEQDNLLGSPKQSADSCVVGDGVFNFPDGMCFPARSSSYSENKGKVFMLKFETASLKIVGCCTLQ